MANRSNTFLLKRSNIVDKIPVLSGLTLGEVALNTADAKLYTLYTNGSITPTEVREIGWNRLSISGGTLYGGLTINGNLSTTSISPVDYIDFNTGSTVSNKSGRLFYDNTSESLTYNSSVNPNVNIKVGQQLYTRVLNNTGSLIPKGSAVTIQSASNTIPEITLAIANAPGDNNQVVGLTSEDIPNGSNGLILNQGLLSGVTISYPIGSILYLSDTTPGGLIASTNSLEYNSRTNQIGYTVETGTTTGIIYVSINNEDINLSLTDIQRNILEGNVISTGVFSYTGLTQISSTQFSVAPVQGWVVNNTYEYSTNPNVIFVDYSGVTSATTPYLSSSEQTYVLISSASTLTLQTTFPTPQERRQNIFLGRVLHPNKIEIQNVSNTVDYDVSPMSALRDLWTPLKLINDGVIVSANGSNLSINTSAGALWGNGIGWTTNQLDPNQVVISSQSPVTFQYRTQLGPITGGTAPYTGNTTFIDPNHYDLNGVVTLVGGGSNSSTNQRVYLFPTGLIRIQYGQQVYTNLASAVAGSQTEQFNEYDIIRDSGILIGIISVQKNVTTLNSSTNAVFNFVSKFGEILGGTGGLSTTTLQQAYNNSSNPEIVTNSIQDGVQFRDGTNNLSSKNIIVEDFSGNQTAWVTAEGGGFFKSIDFNTTATTTTQFGRVNWDSDTGTLNIGVGDSTTGLIDLQVGQEEIVRVYNEEATTLQKGEIVYVFGSQGNRPSVKRAQAQGDLYSVTTLGMVDLAIPSGSEGYVTTFGIISNLNTLGLTGGTPIWLSPTIPGGYTSTKPIAPDHTVLIGYVVRVDATVGSVFVNISNGWELDELHDVRISGATTGDLLMRSSYSGSPVWVNTKTLEGDYTINGELTVTGSTNVSYIDFDTTLTGTTSTEGRLFWDVTNRTLSLGMTSGVTQQIGEEQYYLVEAFNNILDGRVVGAVGTTGASGRILADYMIADGSIPAVSTMGILTQNLNAGDIGYVTNFGLVRGLDTTGIPYGETWSDGDFLYVSPYTGGTLTNIKPTSPNLEILVALVIYANASNGSIFVRPKIGESLETLYDTAISGLTNGDLLTYNSGTNLWSNGKTLNGNYNIIGDLSITTGTLSASTINLYTQPTNNNSNTELLTRNSSTGIVEYKDVSSLIDVHVTGFTYNDSNKLTISRNEGLPNLDVYINNMSGLTVNGLLSSTTINSDSINSLSITGQSFTLATQTQDNTLDNFLVLDSNGNFLTRSFNSLNYIPNLVTVSLTGGTSDFTTIKDAINSITGSSSTNPYTVKVGPGVYYENNPINIPSWVAVVGDDSISTIIQAVDPTQTLFYLGDQSAIFDCQVQGVTGTGVSAIVYSSSTTPQSSAISYVENVRFGANYTHAKVIGSGSANIIMQCSNVKYGGYPFTIGFETTNDGGNAIGRMQLRNVTSTNGGVTTTTGLTFAKADKPNCGFIVNGCLLTKAAGSPAGTGFYVENGAFLRLTGVNFQRWATGIYAPQIGSAPSIDAIALNFENCTTDVNIVHSGTTGKINGTDNFLKTQINIDAPIYEVNQDPREIVVSQKGGDFNSIKAAVDYLIASATTSSDSRYVISVGPGQFYEDEIDLTFTPYVSIVGSNIQTTQIFPNSPTQHLFKIGINNEISFLSISSVGDGSGNYSAIYCDDIGDFAQAHKISFYDCDVNVWVKSSTVDTKFYGEYLDFNGNYSYGVKVEATNNVLALANVENYYQFPTSTGTTIGNYLLGSGSTLNAALCTFEGNGASGSTCFYIEDGATLNVGSSDVNGWGYGLYNSSAGLGSNFEIIGSSFIDNTYDLYIDRTTTKGYFQGISDHTKIYLTPGTNDVYWSFLDSDGGEFDITRKASVTFTDGSHTDLTTLLFEGGTMGLLDGGVITVITGTTVQTALGFGYLEKSDNSGIIRRIDWSDTQITLPINSNEYIYINENGNLSSSGSKPNSFYNIILGRVVTNSTGVEFIDLSPLNGEHTSNRFSNLFTEALGPIYAFGSIVTEGSTPLTINVSSGEYYFSTNEFMPIGGTGLTFTQYYRSGTGATWVTTATTVVNNTQWDNNGTLTGLTSGYYTKHTLYLLGQGVYENYFLVLGQNQYPTLVEAEDALLSTPPTYFSDSVVQIANIYVQEGTSGFTEVEDIRPTIAFRAGGVNASSVHSNLLGLSSDDHTQYLLVNGARAMSGNLDMGNNTITSASTVNGVVVQSHASRHLPNGLDPLTTGIPSSIGLSNQEGILNAFARQDHIHQLGSNVVLDDNIATQVSSKITITGKTQLNNFIVYTDQLNSSISATTYYGDGSNLTGLITTDYYVTGGTFSGTTLTLNRQNGSVVITGFTSGTGTDNFVTGGTYNSGTLTLDRQNGSVTVTGFTTGIKAGTVAGTSFSGNPKKFTVTFTSPYPNTNYSITITGAINRSFTWESKLANGFTINSNANTSFTEDVNWITMSYGEF